MATDGLTWIFIDKNGEETAELDLLENYDKIEDFLLGEERVISQKTEEEITKRFYDWYNALLHGGRYKDRENKTKWISENDCLVNNIFNVQNLDDKEQIAQSIVNRLIFIKFLQSKEIIEKDILAYLSDLSEDILNEKLKQLFFRVLNTPKDERIDIDPNFGDIPYLNGSLFIKTDVERQNTDYRMKAEILKEIIKFLDSFRFIHKESFENGDSIDPEILGYIFERAMTSSDRKGTGAYYTPKQITKYIAENTVYPCIIEKINVFLKEEKGYKEKELIKDINDVFILHETTLNEIWNKIILNLKVCDNACGSGAFLLSAGNILFDLSKKICKKLNIRNPDPVIKKMILLKNLYGVDINPNAVEIAKLRLWLWLVASYDPENIQPLPNIEYNLRSGNTLLGYVDISRFKDVKSSDLEYWTNENSLYDLLEEREKLIKTYKVAKYTEFKKLRRDIEEINDKIEKLLDFEFYKELKSKKIEITRENFDKLKPFHWGFEFSEVFDSESPEEERGFDVIIGNPPYVRVESLDHKLSDLYKVLYNSVYQRCDIYVAFIQTSFEKINKYGRVGLITANQYMVAEYGTKIREILTTKYGISKIINFTHFPVFLGISIYTAIIIGSKKLEDKTKCIVFESEDATKFMRRGGLDDNVEHPDIKKFYVKKVSLKGSVWTLKSKDELEIFNKVKSKNVKNLSDFSLIGSPLKTGRDSILYQILKKEDSKFYHVEYKGRTIKFEKEIWKEVLRPRILGKWNYKEPKTLVFFPYKIKNEKFNLISENEFKERFPLTYSFILDSKDILLKRKDSRKTWQELGRKWYSLHRIGIPQNYFGTKILTQSVIKEPTFCIDNKNYFYPTGGVLGIVPKNMIYAHFLLAYLNSNLVYFLIKSKAPVKRGGYISLDVGLISEILVPIDKDLLAELSILAKEILREPETIEKNEKRINEIIYNFFGLSQKEQKIIEESLK